MKSNRVETCNIIRQRMADQLAAMSNIREVHGLRAWHEVADKNYYKSLDRKCFELKKNEREYIKQAHFDAEL
jgi:histone deacetylase complex regulatory component SIN3